MIDITMEIRSILNKYGVTDQEVLENTPSRVSKAFDELWSGTQNPLPRLAFFDAKEGMVVRVDSIEFNSTCEHHLMPFFGHVTIELVSSGKTLGLSKFNRIVRHVAARPTIQEKMCSDIFSILDEALDPKALTVTVSAKHTCVAHRGIKDGCSNTVTVLSK